MSHMSQNFRLFHVSNESVLNLRIFMLMYPGSLSAAWFWPATGGGDFRAWPVPCLDCLGGDLGVKLTHYLGAPSARPAAGAIREGRTMTPDTWAEKFESLERINSTRKTNWIVDSCGSCKRLVSCINHRSQNFHLFHTSHFTVLTFRPCLLVYPGSASGDGTLHCRPGPVAWH